MNLESYRFPLFVDLHGRKAVVVGGGKIALRRVQILQSFGAEVTMIAPHCTSVPEGVTYLCRPYAKGDVSGAFLAVAATDNRAVNQQVGQEAKDANIFVSVADRRDESTFFFPAICEGSGLVAGVVSEGDAHKKTAQAAKVIRNLLEDMP